MSKLKLPHFHKDAEWCLSGECYKSDLLAIMAMIRAYDDKPQYVRIPSRGKVGFPIEDTFCFSFNAVISEEHLDEFKKYTVGNKKLTLVHPCGNLMQ
ncbi:hypothetical protein KAR91_59555 [Candidatus Pacearchaeota archaeon]|nr:hypothetical protein [Candidatus Pacearchaeota archaeon]